MSTQVVATDLPFLGPDWQCGCGLGVWLNRRGGYRLDGAYGQFSIVLPDLAVVVTTTAHLEGSTEPILDAVWDELLPRLH